MRTLPPICKSSRKDPPGKDEAIATFAVDWTRTEVIWSGTDEAEDECQGDVLDEEEGCPITIDRIFGCASHFLALRWSSNKKVKFTFLIGFIFFLTSISVTQVLSSWSCGNNGGHIKCGWEKAEAFVRNAPEKQVGQARSRLPYEVPSSFPRKLNGKTDNFRFGTTLYAPGEIDALHPKRVADIPKTIDENLADIDEPLRLGDVPYFFHIPRAGGSTLKDIVGSCINVVTSSDVGARIGHGFDSNLTVVLSEEGSRFVNVDTSTLEGIHLARIAGLVESGLTGLITTQYFHAGSSLFSKNNKGRMFTLMRHPIERAVSLFHYLAVAYWEPTYDPDLAHISIEMYARSTRVEHNWMVRFLTNELERDLTPHHLDLAKEILRKKCIVGLLDKKGESWLRLERFFGWKCSSQQSRECKERLLHWGWSNKHSHPSVEEGSLAWNLLYKKNELDIMLYQYARLLFKEQSSMLGDTISLNK